jgi:membrane fusion protein (multidrug efflux system)
VYRLPRFTLIACIALLAACGGGGEGGAKGKEGGGNRPPPLVKVEPASSIRFVEKVEAIGTANANEQVTLSAGVTERIERLNFDDGGFVRAGQVIAVLAQGQEQAQLSEAQARAREAGQQLARIEELKSRGFATKSNLDQQVAAAAQARAQAAQARATIGDRNVRAPFSGWVSLRNISAGAVVNAGGEIATISDLSSIKLDFTVPETLLPVMKAGLPIEARSAAYPDQPFRGTVATVDPVIDPNTRAVTVRARLPNPNLRLKPGMMLTVNIETAPRVGLAVPELAVIGEGDNRFVYVVGPDGTAKRVPVKTGLRQEGRIEIVDGLRPGQQVVTEGVVKLADGMKVRLAGTGNAQRAEAGGGRTRTGS